MINESILATPWNDIFYEGVPMNEANMMMPYFWIARKTSFSKSLRANPSVFWKYFKKSKKRIVNFTSPSGTILIAPSPGKDYKYNLHLKKFVEKANPKLVDQFWKTIGNQMQKIFKSKTKSKETWWLKTHGHAVNYLHFRIQNNTRLFVTKELIDVISAYDFYKKIIN